MVLPISAHAIYRTLCLAATGASRPTTVWTLFWSSILCQRGSKALHCWRNGRAMKGWTPGRGAAPYKHTKKTRSLPGGAYSLRPTKFCVWDIRGWQWEGGGRGRRWCDKHRCVPRRTAFLCCALSADCRGRGGFHLMGSMDRKQQETEQRNIAWNRYLRQDNEWIKGHFLLPQFWAAWGKFDAWGPENTLIWASAGVLFILPHSRKGCILTFPSCSLATTAVQKIFHGVLSVLEREFDGFFCPQTVLSSREVPVFEGLGVTAQGFMRDTNRLISKET